MNSAWTMNERWPENYRSPFERAHCGVDALAIIAELTPAEARRLAELGRRTESSAMPGRRLLMEVGSTWIVDLEQWAGLIAHRVTRVIKFAPRRLIKALALNPQFRGDFDDGKLTPRVTVKTFCRQHPTGRWYVVTRGHAFAVIDGEPHGQYWMRGRVLRAARLVRDT